MLGDMITRRLAEVLHALYGERLSVHGRTKHRREALAYE